MPKEIERVKVDKCWICDTCKAEHRSLLAAEICERKHRMIEKQRMCKHEWEYKYKYSGENYSNVIGITKKCWLCDKVVDVYEFGNVLSDTVISPEELTEFIKSKDKR